MSEKREDGWYWVKDGSDWKPARWCQASSGWFVGKRTIEIADFYEEVGDRIPTPDEPWKCVPLEPTTRQIGAGIEAYDGRCEDSYRAMLAAAPKPGGE